MTANIHEIYPQPSGLRAVRAATWTVMLGILCVIPAAAQNWTRATGIPAEMVTAVAVDGTLPYAATDSALYRSMDGGFAWQRTPGQPAGIFFSALQGVGGDVYAGSRGDGIFISRDSGATWTDFSNGLNGGARDVVAFARMGDSLYAGTAGAGVYVRRLQGDNTWWEYNDGLFQFGTTALLATDRLLVGCIGMYVFVRGRGEAQWVVSQDSVQGPSPLSLARHDTSLFLGTSTGVYRGSLDGRTWRKADIPQFANQDIVALASAGSRLYAGGNYHAEHWIFSTGDGGTTWEIRAHEFAPLVSLQSANGIMWAGRSDGLWWFDMKFWTSVTPVAGRVPLQPELHQNYPNPFNPTTTIRFMLPRRASVNVSIHNTLGVQVATLVDADLNAGVHEVQFDASGLASGVYLVRLRSDGHEKLAKSLLLR